MKKQSGPSSRDLPNIEKCTAFIDSEDPSIIGECKLFRQFLEAFM